MFLVMYCACHVDQSIDSDHACQWQCRHMQEGHFERDHYLCPEPVCLERKFVVFNSEFDLKAHNVCSHDFGLSSVLLTVVACVCVYVV
jgi:hypothetical protein